MRSWRRNAKEPTNKNINLIRPSPSNFLEKNLSPSPTQSNVQLLPTEKDTISGTIINPTALGSKPAMKKGSKSQTISKESLTIDLDKVERLYNSKKSNQYKSMNVNNLNKQTSGKKAGKRRIVRKKKLTPAGKGVAPKGPRRIISVRGIKGKDAKNHPLPVRQVKLALNKWKPPTQTVNFKTLNVSNLPKNSLDIPEICIEDSSVATPQYSQYQTGGNFSNGEVSPNPTSSQFTDLAPHGRQFRGRKVKAPINMRQFSPEKQAEIIENNHVAQQVRQLKQDPCMNHYRIMFPYKNPLVFMNYQKYREQLSTTNNQKKAYQSSAYQTFIKEQMQKSRKQLKNSRMNLRSQSVGQIEIDSDDEDLEEELNFFNGGYHRTDMFSPGQSVYYVQDENGDEILVQKTETKADKDRVFGRSNNIYSRRFDGKYLPSGKSFIEMIDPKLLDIEKQEPSRYASAKIQSRMSQKQQKSLLHNRKNLSQNTHKGGFGISKKLDFKRKTGFKSALGSKSQPEVFNFNQLAVPGGRGNPYMWKKMTNSTAHLIDIERRKRNPAHRAKTTVSFYVPPNRSTNHSANPKNRRKRSQRKNANRKWLSNYSKIQQKAHRPRLDKSSQLRKIRIDKNSSSMPDLSHLGDLEMQMLKKQFQIKSINPGVESEGKSRNIESFSSHKENINFAKPVPQLLKIKKPQYDLMTGSSNRSKIKGRMWAKRFTHKEMLEKKKQLYKKLHQPKKTVEKFQRKFAAEVKDEEFENFKDMLMVDTMVGESMYNSRSQRFTSFGGGQVQSRSFRTEYDPEIDQI